MGICSMTLNWWKCNGSHEIERDMNLLDINKHKKRSIVDTISAVYILEIYLNKTKNS